VPFEGRLERAHGAHYASVLLGETGHARLTPNSSTAGERVGNRAAG
jgi:hypothetical protein